MKLFVVLLFLPIGLFAQRTFGQSKNSTAQGILYAYWGNNRSFYSRSNLHFEGTGYDFNLKGVRATDSKTPFQPSIYFNPAKLTLLQYNVRVGYYIREGLAVAIGFDHMKYAFSDKNEVALSGTINPGIDTVNNWNGSYTSFPIVTDRNTFDYNQTKGLNYLKVELIKTHRFYEADKNNWFVFSANYGLGLGALLSTTNFTFAGKTNISSSSYITGLALSAQTGIRLEFFKHFFFQTTFSGGYMQQLRVPTRNNQPNAIAKQKFGYFSIENAIGFFLNIRSTNDCNSCPNW
ncbi:MAG: hypothetical protein RI883_261 [Bacteroidota bacterium]|jgi:hypothetical protein